MADERVASLLERAFMFLEDGEWQKADEYCEKVLDTDPKNAEAYLGKLMVEYKAKTKENLKNVANPFNNSKNYQKVIRFGDDEVKTELEGYIDIIREQNKEELYLEACKNMKDPMQYENALKSLAWLAEKNYRDSEEKAGEVKRLIEDKEDKQKALAERRKNRIKRVANVFFALIGAVATLILVVFVIVPAFKYGKAEKMEAKGNYVEAAVLYGKAGGFLDAEEKSFELWSEITLRETVSAGYNHTIAIRTNGTVVAVGDNTDGQCDVGGWRNMAAVSTGEDYTVGLKTDGTVVSTRSFGNVDNWKNIVAVSASDSHIVGLKSDGTVVSTRSLNDVDSWENIVAVSAGDSHTVGLKSDGTVVAVGNNNYGQCDVDGWRDIVAISAGNKHTVGLKSDGTVVAVGYNHAGQCDVDEWSDIVAVSAGSVHTVALKSDGTVVSVGYNGQGRCNVDGWCDIVAVSAGNVHTVGLKSDGTVISTLCIDLSSYFKSDYGQCDVDGWKNIKIPDTIK